MSERRNVLAGSDRHDGGTLGVGVVDDDCGPARRAKPAERQRGPSSVALVDDFDREVRPRGWLSKDNRCHRCACAQPFIG